MKPQDVIKQLIGETVGWNAIDTMAFQFDDPSKFPNSQVADINFESGIAILQSFDEDGDLRHEQRFAIKATLEPLDPANPADQGQEQLPLGNLGAL